MITVKEKLALVGWLDPQKDADWRKLADLLRDEDNDVRYDAVERIGYNLSRETTDLLLEALDDPDELVRVQCLEELGYRKDLTAADAGKLRPNLDDESELVRRYAASALAAAGDLSVIPLFKERLDRVSTTEQSSYCFALVALGQQAYLDRALGLLESDCYQTRCSVANSLGRIVDDGNRQRIVTALERTWQTEVSRAVWTTIERVMQETGMWEGIPKREPWQLVPNISLGPFVIGTKIDDYVARFGARLEEESDADLTGWQNYSLPHSDDYLCAEDGLLVSATARGGVTYKGAELVGLTIADLESLLGCCADDIGDAVEYDDGEVQTPYDFNDLGLQVWTVDDKVVTVSCLDYREEDD